MPIELCDARTRARACAEHLAGIFDRVDTNHDGTLSYAEFCECLASEPSIASAFMGDPVRPAGAGGHAPPPPPPAAFGHNGPLLDAESKLELGPVVSQLVEDVGAGRAAAVLEALAAAGGGARAVRLRGAPVPRAAVGGPCWSALLAGVHALDDGVTAVCAAVAAAGVAAELELPGTSADVL